MIGPLLMGMFVGLIVGAGLIITGAGFLLALAAYSVSGTIATILAALWQGGEGDVIEAKSASPLPPPPLS